MQPPQENCVCAVRVIVVKTPDDSGMFYRYLKSFSTGNDGKTIGVNTVCGNCFPGKHCGERAYFTVGKPLSNNTSALKIKNDIEVVIATDCGPKFSGDPNPHLVVSHEVFRPLRLWLIRYSVSFKSCFDFQQYSINHAQ